MSQAPATLDSILIGPNADQKERTLDPISRVSEILFGLIMALTFTCTLSVAEAGREEIRTLLAAAISCNIAWGLVDAVMFLINAVAGRGRDLITIRHVRDAASAERARGIIKDAVPPLLGSLLSNDDLERLRHGILNARDIPAGPRLTKDDWAGALAVFLLVVLSTFPVVIPFILFRDAAFALRTSNIIAIALLFAGGHVLARYAGFRPWRTALSMVGVGVALVVITIALGG
jgi:VIT1/CCC1 family predicted Fe2+/Mn2+ transporter